MRSLNRTAALVGALVLALTACGPGGVDVEAPGTPTPAPASPSPTPAPSPSPSPSPSPEPQAGPTPDPAAVADPCAEHQERTGEAFIEVVSPVAEQRVAAGGDVELVGCSNVFEATVAWELYDGDGRLLDEGFTTAECGTGCVGAFRETLSLQAATGEPFVELHVFWHSPRDGAREDLVAVPLVVE